MQPRWNYIATFYRKFLRKKKNKSITCSSYWYNFKQFPRWDLLFKKFIPAKEYLQIEILNAFAWILTQDWKKRKTVTQIFSNALPDSVRSDFGRTLRVQWKSSDGQNIQASHLPIYIVSSKYERSLTTVWFYTTRTIYYKLQENCCYCCGRYQQAEAANIQGDRFFWETCIKFCRV